MNENPIDYIQSELLKKSSELLVACETPPVPDNRTERELAVATTLSPPTPAEHLSTVVVYRAGQRVFSNPLHTRALADDSETNQFIARALRCLNLVAA